MSYFAGWGIYQRKGYLSDIKASEISHICYAFGFINPEGVLNYWTPEAITSFTHDYDKKFYTKGQELFTGGAKTEINMYKANKPVHFGLSIGGDSFSTNIGATFADANLRKKFVDSLAQRVIEDNFDFVDVDWEFPSGADSDNFIAFLKEIQAAMKADGRERYVTGAFSAGVSNLMPLKLKDIFDQLAFGNIMTYCMSCGPKTASSHDAPYYGPDNADSISGTIKYIKSVGVPAEKIIIGFAAYGQGFANCSAIGAPFQGTAAVPAKFEANRYDFSELAELKDRLEEGYDAQAIASFSVIKGANVLISHDTQKSVSEKLRLAFQEGCGGAFVWYSAQDSKTADFNLSNWINDAIIAAKSNSALPPNEIAAKYFPSGSGSQAAASNASVSAGAGVASQGTASAGSASQQTSQVAGAAGQQSSAAAGAASQQSSVNQSSSSSAGSVSSQNAAAGGAVNVPEVGNSKFNALNDMQKCMKVCKCISENL